MSRIAKAIDETGLKTETGLKISTICAQAFKKIFSNIEDLVKMVTEISNATGEQEKGIRQTSVAINNLSQVSTRNTQLAKQASDMASFLQNQATALKLNITSLERTIGGVVNEKSEGIPTKVISKKIKHTA